MLMVAALTGVGIFYLYAKDDESLIEPVVWKVGYVDPEHKLQDYVYSTSEKGCRCGQQPYAFSSAYLELPGSFKDSSLAIERFHELYSKSNLVHEAYPYCLVKDWEELDDKGEDGYLLTDRTQWIDTWLVCHRFGLIDSLGHYTYKVDQP